jgi:hypothetical protein
MYILASIDSLSIQRSERINEQGNPCNKDNSFRCFLNIECVVNRDKINIEMFRDHRLIWDLTKSEVAT